MTQEDVLSIRQVLVGHVTENTSLQIQNIVTVGPPYTIRK